MDAEFKQTVKIFGALFGVLLFGVLLGVSLVNIGYVPVGQDHVSSAQSAEESKEEIRVDLAVDYGNSDAQAFPGLRMRQGDTVLDMLETLDRAEGVAIEKRNFPGLGVFIEAIHGVHNTSTSYWQFWVNGEYARVGAGEYVLKDGDQVLWKRTNERPE